MSRKRNGNAKIGTASMARRKLKGDNAAASAHNSMMDEVYKPLLRKSRKCSIDFIEGTGPRNYILYDVRYERSFVSYTAGNGDGSIRYGITDYAVSYTHLAGGIRE